MKTNSTIQCPSCGVDIDVSQALIEEIQGRVTTRVEREQSEQFAAERAALESTHKQQLEAAKQAAERAAAKSSQEQITTANAALTKERAAQVELRAQLEAATIKQREAEQNELKLRKEQQAVSQRAEQLELEVARKLDAERQTIQSQAREQIAQEFSLKLQEKENQIQGLNQSLSDAKRRAEQGSQEAQGEALEVSLEAQLSQWYTLDRFEPVPKGVRGADLIQTVVNNSLQDCGKIIWEFKNTKNWSAGWVQKLKDDKQAAASQIAVLVSVVLPPEIKSFGLIDGIWVCHPTSLVGLSQALRVQLHEVAFLKAASKGQQGKAEMVYDYLVSDAFRSKIEAIVESFSLMEDQINRERRAMTKQWKAREQLILRMSTNTVGMYGELSGIVGKGLPQVKAIELDDFEESDESIQDT